MTTTQHTPVPDADEAPGVSQSEPIPLGTLLLVNLRLLLVVAVLGAAAFALWRGLAALFPEIDWLQYPA
ncbi:MAG: hypothetical protein QGI93_14795 [Planctomycetota bacterium]|jgi:hypothetical protein|nr:hypothetical protein [Planctomycetota bacterium]